LGNDKPNLLGRAFFGAMGVILFFYTIHNAPLATAVTLQYLSPFFATITGIWMVKERVRLIQYVFFAISFLGIFIIKGFDPLYRGILLFQLGNA